MIITNSKESDLKLFPAFYGSINNLCPRCDHLLSIDVVDNDRFCFKCGWREVLADGRPVTVDEQREAIAKDDRLLSEGREYWAKRGKLLCEKCGSIMEFRPNRRYCSRCRAEVEDEQNKAWAKRNPYKLKKYVQDHRKRKGGNNAANS